MCEAGTTDIGVLLEQPVSSQTVGLVSGPSNLTFEQQKELLQLQLKQQLELERLRFEREVQLETLKHKTEQAKLEVQHYRLELVKEGRSSEGFRTEDGQEMAAGRDSHMDLVNNLCLLPKFSESDPDTFFSFFERVAEARK